MKTLGCAKGSKSQRRPQILGGRVLGESKQVKKKATKFVRPNHDALDSSKKQTMPIPGLLGPALRESTGTFLVPREAFVDRGIHKTRTMRRIVSKRMRFNLGDDEQEDDLIPSRILEAQDLLRDDFHEDLKGDSDDPDELDDDETAARFVGVDDEAPLKKSKKEVMKEILQKSKQSKSLAARNRAHQEMALQKLDSEFQDLRKELEWRSGTAEAPNCQTVEAIAEELKKRALQREPDDFLRELQNLSRSPKGKASDRTKSEEEIANERKRELERAAEEREKKLRKLRSLEDDDDAHSAHSQSTNNSDSSTEGEISSSGHTSKSDDDVAEEHLSMNSDLESAASDSTNASEIADHFVEADESAAEDHIPIKYSEVQNLSDAICFFGSTEESLAKLEDVHGLWRQRIVEDDQWGSFLVLFCTYLCYVGARCSVNSDVPSDFFGACAKKLKVYASEIKSMSVADQFLAAFFAAAVASIPCYDDVAHKLHETWQKRSLQAAEGSATQEMGIVMQRAFHFACTMSSLPGFTTPTYQAAVGHPELASQSGADGEWKEASPTKDRLDEDDLWFTWKDSNRAFLKVHLRLRMYQIVARIFHMDEGTSSFFRELVSLDIVAQYQFHGWSAWFDDALETEKSYTFEPGQTSTPENEVLEEYTTALRALILLLDLSTPLQPDESRPSLTQVSFSPPILQIATLVFLSMLRGEGLQLLSEENHRLLFKSTKLAVKKFGQYIQGLIGDTPVAHIVWHHWWSPVMRLAEQTPGKLAQLLIKKLKGVFFDGLNSDHPPLQMLKFEPRGVKRFDAVVVDVSNHRFMELAKGLSKKPVAQDKREASQINKERRKAGREVRKFTKQEAAVNARRIAMKQKLRVEQQKRIRRNLEEDATELRRAMTGPLKSNRSIAAPRAAKVAFAKTARKSAERDSHKS